jgi:UDP-N-acetyl-D-mannosaminouronate:lipid I N-acetyl-D-mannosaminouronosyltransferase
MQTALINNIKIFGPSSLNEFLTSEEVLGKKLVAMNAEKIYHATDELRKIYAESVNYPDGIGAVWALKSKGVKTVVKVPGCELWLHFIRYYLDTKTFYFVGSSEEVIQDTIKKLKGEFPSIRIAGFRNGYLKTEEEKQDLISDIVSKKPDFVFIAMGSPKQEQLINEIHAMHPATYQGLGGSFDVYTGKVNRAPKIWIKLNLEWAYRLFLQPKRILRQYVLLLFLFKLIFKKY